MAFNAPPPPPTNDTNSPAYKDWLYKMAQYLATGFSADWDQIILPTVDANEVFAGPPDGSPGTASFRHLVSADIPQRTYTHVAGAALGGDRVVYIDNANTAQYADNTNLAIVNTVLGITTGAAAMGANVEIQTEGEYTEPSWTWTLGQPIFLGTNGLLTQTQPSAPAFSLIIGFPITATKIFLRFNNPIVLA